MELGFGEVLLFSGALLAIAAALSGLFHGTVLSVSVLGVALGAGLAAVGAVDISPDDDTTVQLIELALIVTLFSDGLFVQRELLIVHWSAPVRALALAMPLTLLFLAGCAKLLFGDLAWAEAFLLAAVLSPTDPVVTSTVVTSQRVPESDPPHPQPRVRSQRRPRAALRALLHRAGLARRGRRQGSSRPAG